MTTDADKGGGDAGERLTVRLEMVDDYQFTVTFGEEGELGELLMDEPEPLGDDRGPNASRVLAAAVGNCLSASLLFCLRKSKLEPASVTTEATAHMTRNERGRLRVGRVEVDIRVDADPDEPARLDRCLEIFEDYCVVTQSVRDGLDVEVAVRDAAGNELHRSREAEPASA